MPRNATSAFKLSRSVTTSEKSKLLCPYLGGKVSGIVIDQLRAQPKRRSHVRGRLTCPRSSPPLGANSWAGTCVRHADAWPITSETCLTWAGANRWPSCPLAEQSARSDEATALIGITLEPIAKK